MTEQEFTSPQPYDHERANVGLRAEIVAMHRVIESQRHRISQAEALAETLREDLADAEKPLAALRAEVERLRTAIGDIGITNSLGYEGRISITAAHGSIAALVSSALEVSRG